MGVLILPLTLVVAWVLALAGVTPPGTYGGKEFDAEALRWMLTLPLGYMMVVSGFMHTVLAKKTAANIGWESSPFQYELGFCSLGIGVGSIVAAYLNSDAWIPLAIIATSFLVFAGINHIVEMVKKKNFSPGNTLVLIYDFGLPLSLWPLLCSAGVL